METRDDYVSKCEKVVVITTSYNALFYIITQGMIVFNKVFSLRPL